MNHNRNDETEEGDQVLNYEELVREVSEGRKCAEVNPKQECIGGKAGRWTGICRPLELHQTVLVPAIALVAEVKCC